MSFKLMRSKRIFRGRIFELNNETWRGPDAKRFERQTIIHPGAVAVVPEDAKNRILMIRQHRPAVRKKILEIPAGTLEVGEKPLNCAKRELIEEIGFAASSWKRLGAVYTAPGFCSEKITIYRAWDLKPAHAEKDEDEYIEMVAMSKRQVKDAVKKGRICDAKTLSALLLMNWLS